MNEAQLSQATHRPSLPWRSLLLGCALTAAATLPFGPAIRGGWVYDDFLLIAQDSRLQSWGGLLELWSSDLFSALQFALQLGDHRPFYRPVVATSYAWDWWWGGGAPTAFHVTNLLFHAAATGLGLMTLVRWGASLPVALGASLCFALHPTRAESVAWISGRTDVMSAVFLLAGAHFYARAREPSLAGVARKAWWGAAYLAAALALLSKETAVLFPVFALVEEWQRDGRPLQQFFWNFRAWWRPWLGTVALVGLYVVGRALFLPLTSSSSGLSLLSPHHLQLIAETAGRHAEYLFFPHDLTLHRSRLAFDTEGRPLLSARYVTLGASALLTYLALIFFTWRRPRLWWLLILAGALLVPTANLAPTGLSFSAQARYTYLALLPLAAALFLAIEAAAPRFWMAAPLLLLLAWPTWTRSGDFLSDAAFWRAEFRNNPGIPEPIQQKMSSDLRTVGRETYLRRALCGYERSHRHFGPRQAAAFVKLAVRVLADDPSLSPDRQAKLLKFLEALTDGHHAELHDQLTISLPPESSIARSLRRSAPQLHLMAAHLRLRRGDVAGALDRARRMLRVCPDCEDLRMGAALVPLVAGREGLLRDWSAALPLRQRQKVGEAFALLHDEKHRSPAERAWSAAEAGRILGLAAFSFQAMYPHLSAIARSAPGNIRMAVTLMARNVGDLDTARVMFSTLPQAERLRLTREGTWSAPVLDRDAAFVEGTCALPSELEKR